MLNHLVWGLWRNSYYRLSIYKRVMYKLQKRVGLETPTVMLSIIYYDILYIWWSSPLNLFVIPSYLEVIEHALASGETVLIENLKEKVEPVLEPLLCRNTIRRGRFVRKKPVQWDWTKLVCESTRVGFVGWGFVFLAIPSVRTVLTTRCFSPRCTNNWYSLSEHSESTCGLPTISLLIHMSMWPQHV